MVDTDDFEDWEDGDADNGDLFGEDEDVGNEELNCETDAFLTHSSGFRQTGLNSIKTGLRRYHPSFRILGGGHSTSSTHLVPNEELEEFNPTSRFGRGAISPTELGKTAVQRNSS